MIDAKAIETVITSAPNGTVLTVEELLAGQGADPAHQPSRVELTGILRALHEQGKGVYKIGRKGHPSRFEVSNPGFSASVDTSGGIRLEIPKGVFGPPPTEQEISATLAHVVGMTEKRALPEPKAVPIQTLALPPIEIKPKTPVDFPRSTRTFQDLALDVATCWARPRAHNFPPSCPLSYMAEKSYWQASNLSGFPGTLESWIEYVEAALPKA